jgi:hypothetical protein
MKAGKDLLIILNYFLTLHSIRTYFLFHLNVTIMHMVSPMCVMYDSVAVYRMRIREGLMFTEFTLHVNKTSQNLRNIF